jgi:hypothetical protein
MAPAELSPAGPTHQALAVPTAGASTPGAGLTPAEAAWLRFVERVERGEITDPSGQYVAKGTPGAVDAAGHRLSRPKFDAKTPAFARHYRLRTRAVAASGSNESTPTANYVEPCDPCIGGGPTVVSTFTTSETLGGSGNIHDLKLVGDATSPSRARVLNNGYTMLEADLNRGAGGAYIYLCFQRDAANVLNGLEYYQGQPYSGPNDFLTNFQTQNGSLTNKPLANTYFFDIWQPNQNPYFYWGPLDLNAGASGEYIYSYQSKTPIVINSTGGTDLWPSYSEIGILSGNSSIINPPAGWTKYPHDLNEGAGGDYIYFCYR